jgi:hypothetical protein
MFLYKFFHRCLLRKQQSTQMSVNTIPWAVCMGGEEVRDGGHVPDESEEGSWAVHVD